MSGPSPALQDEFEHFCGILASFSVGNQEAFEEAWNKGDVKVMVDICEAHDLS
jgi:hypothetical protein